MLSWDGKSSCSRDFAPDQSSIVLAGGSTHGFRGPGTAHPQAHAPAGPRQVDPNRRSPRRFDINSNKFLATYLTHPFLFLSPTSHTISLFPPQVIITLLESRVCLTASLSSNEPAIAHSLFTTCKFHLTHSRVHDVLSGPAFKFALHLLESPSSNSPPLQSLVEEIGWSHDNTTSSLKRVPATNFTRTRLLTCSLVLVKVPPLRMEGLT